MVHALSIWLLVAGFFGAGLFNAIGTPATQSDFARWGYPRWWGRFTGGLEIMIGMTRNTSVVLYIVVMIAVVVGVDLLFFKNRFWERLIVNIGIVLVFAAFYLRFLKSP